jgi:hypothetical protein
MPPPKPFSKIESAKWDWKRMKQGISAGNSSSYSKDLSVDFPGGKKSRISPWA